MVDMISFKKGLKASMLSAKVPGTMLVQTDTGNMYVGINAGDRIQIKDDTKLPLTGGTLTGDLTMGPNKIIFDDSNCSHYRLQNEGCGCVQYNTGSVTSSNDANFSAQSQEITNNSVVVRSKLSTITF